MISESEARSIAANWHGGQWSSLYAFSSTGTIDEGLIVEIERCFNSTAIKYEYSGQTIIKELNDLLEYVKEHDASNSD